MLVLVVEVIKSHLALQKTDFNLYLFKLAMTVTQNYKKKLITVITFQRKIKESTNKYKF